MKKIMCYVMDKKHIKEYEMSYEEEVINQFLQEMENNEIVPFETRENGSNIEVLNRKVDKFNKVNEILNYQDVKNYIRELHASSNLNLIKLYNLMNSDGDMRNIKVSELFRKFFNLYDYKEIYTYEKEKLSQIIRVFYEFGAEVPEIDAEIVEANTGALEAIGFSIEHKIERQNQTEQPKTLVKVIK